MNTIKMLQTTNENGRVVELKMEELDAVTGGLIPGLGPLVGEKLGDLLVNALEKLARDLAP